MEERDVVLRVDSLARDSELVGESEGVDLLGVGDGCTDDGLFGVGGGRRQVDGGDADGDVHRSVGRRRRSGERGGTAAPSAD